MFCPFMKVKAGAFTLLHHHPGDLLTVKKNKLTTRERILIDVPILNSLMAS